VLHFKTYLKDENAPWITFIHGAGGSSAIWFRQIRALRPHCNLLLIDLRGHGKSKSPVYEKIRQYSFEVIGNEVMQVLDHLKIKSSHFVGISLGTIIIRELSERYPERVASMILGGAVMKLNLRSRILLKLGVIFQSVIPYLILYKFFAFIIMPRKRHKESRLLFINEARKLAQKEFNRWFTLVAQLKPLLNLFQTKESHIPTLYIMGAEDHMFLGPIRKMVKNHQAAQLSVIPDCGHVVNVEQADIFNERVKGFIDQLTHSTRA
jgi:pimeloyl-ACP methyl ester carboxylesterase